MSRETLAELKFRPLKKAMQQTFKRIKQAAQADTMPETGAVIEFAHQARLMTSYPGFGDASYPRFLAAIDALALCKTVADLARFKEVVAEICALQSQCHQCRYPARREPSLP